MAEFILVIMLSAMVIMVFGNVVLRYGFNDGIISSEEVSRFLFIWITFLGAIVTMRENGHLGLDSVVRKLNLRGKKTAFAISNVLMLGCCVLMFYGTLKQHGINATTRSAVTAIPMSWVYGVGYITSLAMGSRDSTLSSGHQMTVLIFIVSLLAAMALGMPLAFSLIVSGVALMLHLDNFDTQIVSQNLINGADNFPLMAVPFFMLAGELMNAGGMSRRIVNSAMVWVGHFRGGLGYVAVFAAIVMASLSGSAVADTAALAAVLMPMMRDAGYRMDRSAGLIAAGGIIAPVIPPSIGFILFGVIGGVSISKLFMAGIFPGLLMGFALMVTWWIVARKDKVVVAAKVPFKERIAVTIDAFWCYLLAIAIIGGMKMGIFTPTEAAVVAVVYSLFVGLFIYREIKPKDLYRIILSAAKTSSVVMFLVAAALVSAWLITVANIPAQIVEILRPFIDNKTLLMVMLMLMVLIVGTALDFAPTVLILTPVLMPLVREAGIDPVYFGVLFIINNAIGLLTPPVGTVLNVVCGVGRIPMHDVIRGVMPFLASQVVVMGALIAFPSLVMVPLKWLMMR